MAGTLERLGNESPTDRMVRGVLGVILVVLGYVVRANLTLAVILYVVAAVLIVTALTGFCPIYAVLGISTKAKGPEKGGTPGQARHA